MQLLYSGLTVSGSVRSACYPYATITQGLCYLNITPFAITHAAKQHPAYKFQVLSIAFFRELRIFHDPNQSDGTHSHNKPCSPGGQLCQTLKVLSPMAK